MTPLKSAIALILGSLIATPALAAQLEIGLEIPRLQVAEYHRPYVAVWIEGADGKALANLAVWYELKKTGENQGTRWLPDLRQWWRKSGRSLELPADGITGPTRPVGRHTLQFTDQAGALRTLPAGEHRLVVEVAREVGGRELLRIPFTWKGSSPTQASAAGKSEIGAVEVKVQP